MNYTATDVKNLRDSTGAGLLDCKKALNENDESLFLQNLLNDNELRQKLNENAIKECFDYTYYTKNVDRIFKRVFEI